MTDREYELLDFIRFKGSVKWYEVLNAFGPATEGQVNNAVLEDVLQRELIQSICPGQRKLRRTIRITTKGILALLTAEEQMQRKASVRQKDVQQEQPQESLTESGKLSSGNTQIDPDQDHVRRKREIPQFLRNICQCAIKVIEIFGSIVGIIEFLSKMLA